VFRGLAILTVTLVLAGCAAQQAAKLRAQAQAQAEVDLSNCKQQFPISPRKNHVAQTQCLNEVLRRYSTDAGTRDLVELLAAKQIAIATQLDQGKISEQDGDVLIAQARTEAVSATQQRNNANGVVAAQQEAAAASAMQARANSLQQAGAALQAIGAPPTPTTTCMSTPWAGGVRTTCQ
jgi:hypothetical protein